MMKRKKRESERKIDKESQCFKKHQSIQSRKREYRTANEQLNTECVHEKKNEEEESRVGREKEQIHTHTHTRTTSIHKNK